MAATMSVNNHYGAGPSNVAVTNLRFKCVDENAQDAVGPCVIPSSGGPNLSWWKSIYLKCDSGLGTQINNVKLYTDGGLGWANCTVYVADEMPTHNSASNAGYVAATGTDSSGNTMITNYTGVTARTSLFSFTSASPKTISISETGNVIDANGESTNYIVLQLSIPTTATAGTQTAETLTFQYDEI